MRIWIGDEANGIQAETTINRTHAGSPQVAGRAHCGELAARDRATPVPR
jgi:hypothetical protein